MCRNCLCNEFPDRGNTCLENGSYLLNFTKCADCQHRGLIKIDNYDQQVDDDDEMITYKHLCQECNHVIAEHQYTFRVQGEFQEYMMECMLCGCAEDVRSILPDDPRVQTLY